MKEETEYKQKAEELLKPRYKVIADYPNSLFEVGEILTKIDGISVYSTGRVGIDSYDVSRYPHLFKKLEWWEEREFEELPEYVSYVSLTKREKIYGQLQTSADGFEKARVFVKGNWGDIGDFKRRVNNFFGSTILPATKEEYEAFINSQTTHS